jgi:hypothetical protein
LTSAKAAIITLLTDATQKVHVDDPGVRGSVINHWPDKAEFASNEWIISVGPVIGADAQISSLGSFSKHTWEYIQLDVWVMEKREKSYTVMEKMRSDLVQDVDRCLLHFSATPGTGFMHVNASGWRELDEVGLLRSSMTVEVLYEKAQT